MQLDRPERGFSYAADAPLDMRMDPSAELTAREFVNEADERELADVFRRYGEERYARQIARAIVRRRAQASRSSAPATSSRRSRQAIPAPARFGEGHPAKRVFQALRIEVNDELGSLERALPAALEILRPGRPARGDLVPLARGPDREALPARAGARLHVPARLPALRVRRAAGAAGGAAPRDPARRPPRSRATRARSRRGSAWGSRHDELVLRGRRRAGAAHAHDRRARSAGRRSRSRRRAEAAREREAPHARPRRDRLDRGQRRPARGRRLREPRACCG